MSETFDDANGEGITLTVNRFVQAGSGRRIVYLRIDHPSYVMGGQEFPAKVLGISLDEADAKRLARAILAETA